jgi:hypothetical protein
VLFKDFENEVQAMSVIVILCIFIFQKTFDPTVNVEKYISEMEIKGTWGDGTVLSMAALLYKRQILVMTSDGADIAFNSGGVVGETIRLCHVHIPTCEPGFAKNHYVSLAPTLYGSPIMSVDNDVPATPSPRTAQADGLRSPPIDVQVQLTPNQPDCKNIAVQMHNVKGRPKELRFQPSWFTRHPWLHYDDRLQGVVCFSCAKAEIGGLIDMAKCADSAFVTTGYSNWKKALARFQQHELSFTHRHSVSQLRHVRLQGGINSQLNEQISQDHQLAWKGMAAVFSTLQYLAGRRTVSSRFFVIDFKLTLLYCLKEAKGASVIAFQLKLLSTKNKSKYKLSKANTCS